MSHGQLHAVVRHIRRIRAEAGAEPTDRELLRRFADVRDESAFAELVERHAHLVWGVCSRALRHREDAEDVFQATFLVLARKASAVRWRASIHNWLYEVASRLAAGARVKTARRLSHEARAASLVASETRPDDARRELAAVIDEELHRLPGSCRAPLLLCYLDGQTSDQAARRLGLSLRTLQRRLAQGRELLRHRLTRRGITLSAVLLAPALAEGGGAPVRLLAETARAAVAFVTGGAGAASSVTSLAETMLRGMIMTRIKITALVILVLGTVAGTGTLVCRSPAAPGRPEVEAGPGNDGQAGERGRETAPVPVPFAHRLWSMLDLVEKNHPEPPPRAEMIIGAAKALYKAAGAEPPDDLNRRVAGLTSREQLTTFIDSIWPRAAAAAEVEQAVTEGLFSGVPGSGAFYPPDVVRITDQISGNRYVGIGIQIAMHADEKMPQIVTPYRGGPAHRAGIKPGELIVEVDGKSTRDVTLMKAVDWLRGEEGSTLTVKVRAPGTAEARTVKMTRTVVPFDTVFGYRRAADDSWDFRTPAGQAIGYVHLDSFKASTPHELRQTERRLRADGIRALVLDLRSVGGGSDFHNASLVGSVLLDGGVMWTFRGADRQARECRAGREALFQDWPLAVLINNGVDQAQAAVAAALQDHGRAVLVGEDTRNGGFVTGLLPLPDNQGALAFRTGRLERTGKDRGWPLRPDHAVPLSKGQREDLDKWLRAKSRTDAPGGESDKAPADPQLDKAVELLRAALAGRKP
jgi:C-terminal peptidase prc